MSGFLRRRMFGHNKPGYIVEHMSEEIRFKLRDLISSDISKIPLDQIDGSNEYYAKKDFEKIKLEFDKKIKF